MIKNLNCIHCEKEFIEGKTNIPQNYHYCSSSCLEEDKAYFRPNAQ